MTALPEASPLVRAEWLRRVEAEYRSAVLTQELCLWLMQIGASPDLIRAGLRVVRDELRHADICYRTFVAAGGQGGPTLRRESLQLERRAHVPLELDVARVAVDAFCLGETVAVPLFQRLRRGTEVSGPRRVLDRILLDEVRHRDFGWALLGWLLTLPLGPQIKAQVDLELPRYFGRMRRAYGNRSGSAAAMADADRRWGLMPPADYAEVLDRTLERDWVRRFAEHGIDARAAWSASTG